MHDCTTTLSILVYLGRDPQSFWFYTSENKHPYLKNYHKQKDIWEKIKNSTIYVCMMQNQTFKKKLKLKLPEDDF